MEASGAPHRLLLKHSVSVECMEFLTFVPPVLLGEDISVALTTINLLIPVSIRVISCLYNVKSRFPILWNVFKARFYGGTRKQQWMHFVAPL